jgi:NAD(P)-dependent dehydrogenase (short-subunit alcohol dehydrogenase family)
MAKRRRILIVGASRGLGLGLAKEYLARGWDVVATARNETGEAALAALAGETSGTLSVERLDISRPDQVAALHARLADGRLDVLFVNAGIAGDPDEPVEAVATDEFRRVMTTNALAPLRLVASFRTLVKDKGTIAVMSSDMASVGGNNGGGWEVYRASKAALNQLMRSFTARHAADGRTYLLMSPGWVRTDMGGGNAPLDVATSVCGTADTIAQREGSGGLHFVDYRNKPIPW